MKPKNLFLYNSFMCNARFSSHIIFCAPFLFHFSSLYIKKSIVVEGCVRRFLFWIDYISTKFQYWHIILNFVLIVIKSFFNLFIINIINDAQFKQRAYILCRTDTIKVYHCFISKPPIISVTFYLHYLYLVVRLSNFLSL